ncbi:hypothetical protein QAD02_007851 [Eretmocerus hayati]|uniref:Uncharacterized protein n=1 Tax=Eretmocerus hayati TaxID=131215 RepID=A0ACC2N4U1_9HYME|nr:hypothetical protein QAD02_007851 [Eretmocerus hayati]
MKETPWVPKMPVKVRPVKSSVPFHSDDLDHLFLDQEGESPYFYGVTSSHKSLTATNKNPDVCLEFFLGFETCLLQETPGRLWFRAHLDSWSYVSFTRSFSEPAEDEQSYILTVRASNCWDK